MSQLEESIKSIEKRLSILETGATPERAKVAETSFKTVLDADVHLDNKASRILSAMAFLTAAAAAIFAKAYSSSPTADELQQKIAQGLTQYVSQEKLFSVSTSIVQNIQKPYISLFGLDIALLSFFGYMVFVLLGATLYLAALGPALNIPSSWGHPTDEQKLKSLLFYKLIAAMGKKEWVEYLKNTQTVNLQNQLIDNFIYETWLIAQKTEDKFVWMSFGTISFRIALVWLVVLIGSLLAPYPRSFFWSFTMSGISILLLGFAFETFIRTSANRLWSIWWTASAILLIVYAILISNGASDSCFAVFGSIWCLALSTCFAYITKKKSSPWYALWAILTIFSFLALIVIGVSP